MRLSDERRHYTAPIGKTHPTLKTSLERVTEWSPSLYPLDLTLHLEPIGRQLLAAISNRYLMKSPVYLKICRQYHDFDFFQFLRIAPICGFINFE